MLFPVKKGGLGSLEEEKMLQPQISQYATSKKIQD